MSRFRLIHFILNPAAGPDDGHIEEVRAACESCAGSVVHVLEKGQRISDLVRRAVDAGADLVVAAGGDGTVRAVAESVLPTDLPMGIVPAGSANVFATDLGIPADPHIAVKILQDSSSTLRHVDAPRVNGQLFLVRLSTGWHAAMTAEAPAGMKRTLGRWAYAINAMRIRFRQRRVSYTIVSDGEERMERGVCCIVANSANLGIGNWKVSEDVDISNGRLQVYVIRRASWASIVRLLLRSATQSTTSKSRKHHRGPGDVLEWPAGTIQLDVRPEQVAALDGDRYEGGFPAEIKLDPGALRVVVP